MEHIKESTQNLDRVDNTASTGWKDQSSGWIQPKSGWITTNRNDTVSSMDSRHDYTNNMALT